MEGGCAAEIVGLNKGGLVLFGCGIDWSWTEIEKFELRYPKLDLSNGLVLP